MSEQNASVGKVAATGGMLLVIFRLFAELTSCVGPARALSSAAKVASTAVKVRAAGRGAVTLAEASRALRGVAPAGRVVVGAEGFGRAATEAAAASNAFRNAGGLAVAGEDLAAARAGALAAAEHGTRDAASGARALAEDSSVFKTSGAYLPRSRAALSAEEWAKIVARRQFGNRAAAVLGAAEKPAEGPRVLSFIPDSEETFRNVFKAAFTGSRRREMERYGRLFRKLGNSEVVTSPRYNSESLFSYIRQNPNSDSIIIVGHSEEANTGLALILNNGERVSIERIHEMCLASNSRCLILSCYSNDFRLTGAIRLREAYYMTRRGVDVAGVLENNPALLTARVRAALKEGTLTHTDLMVEAMRSERNVRKVGRVSIVAAGAGAATGTGAALYKVASERASRN